MSVGRGMCFSFMEANNVWPIQMSVTFYVNNYFCTKGVSLHEPLPTFAVARSQAFFAGGGLAFPPPHVAPPECFV